MPTEDRVGLNHLQTSPPTGPQSRQHNPQESVAAVEVQATRRVLLENRKLVTKREDLRLQGRTGSKTGGYQSEKGDEKRAHRGSHHDLRNDRNLFVFRWTEFSVATRPRTARKRTGQRDANWPDWYAAYMVAEQAGGEAAAINDYEVNRKAAKY